MPDDIERNAEFQRRTAMGQDARNRLSVTETAKAIHEHNEKTGKNTTFDQAHRQAVESAHRVERKKSEGD